MDQPHGFQPVHSRHEDVEKQQVEIAGFEDRKPVAAVAGDDDAVAGPFQQHLDGCLDRDVVVDDQDLCHNRSFVSTISRSMFGCESVALSRKRFFGKRPVMLLKKCAGSTPCYARQRADGAADLLNG